MGFKHSLAVAVFLAACNSSDDNHPGSSATIEGLAFNVSPRISGRIKAIYVDEGDVVKAGDVVVELECDEPDAVVSEVTAALSASQARLQQAQAQKAAAIKGVDIATLQTAAAGATVNATRSQISVLDEQIANAKRSVERIQKLRAVGGGTAKQLDDARTGLAVLQQQRAALDANTQAAVARRKATKGGEFGAESQVALADAGIALAQADIERSTAGVTKAKWYQAGCRITAAAPGTVEVRAFEPGEFVGPGTRLLRVVNTATVEATFYVANADLELARPGAEVVVVPDAILNRKFVGTIVSVSESAEFTPRSIQTADDRQRLVYAVRAKINNSDGKLHPGMPVEVRIGSSK